MNERWRGVALAVGVASLAGGLAAIMGAGSGTTPAVATALYAAGAVVAVGMALLVVRDWQASTDIDPPAVERALTPDAPGDDIDRTVAQFDGSGTGYLPDRSALHDRLRELAATILARRRGTGDADDPIEDGEWPADERVNAFLRNVNAAAGTSLSTRLRGVVGRSATDFQRLVARTVETLEGESGVLDHPARGRLVLDPADETRHTTAELDAPDTVAGRLHEGVTAGRWRPLVPLGVGFVGLGLFARDAGIVLAGAVPIGAAALARVRTPPPATLAVERTVEATDPDPGETVTVRTTIHNEGEQTLPDLRLVDGVPEALSVAEGSPRRGTTLRGGESTTITYDVTACRGVHDFDPVYAVVRDDAGRSARARLVGGPDTTLSCVPPLEALPATVPLYEHATESLGRIPAGGGDGTAFYATRAYRPGDPTSRIDWKRLARSPDGELTTVEFREEQAAPVVVALETTPAAYTAPDPDTPTAIERSIAAARQVCGSLLASGDRVGLAAIGPTPMWVSPATGVDHRKRLERTLATDAALPATAPESGRYSPRWAREFHRRFPVGTQVVLLSTLTDSLHRFMIYQLRAYGHPVTVLSPNVTAEETVGQRFVRLERRLRVRTLREAGVRVIDWGAEEELAVALRRATSRWSA